MRARRSWAWLLSFAFSAVAPGTRPLCAQVPENAGLVLGYQAPDGCPDRIRFEQRLRARLPQRAAAAAQIEVRITREGSKSVGELSLVRAGEEPAVRTIEAPRCEEVVEALALAAALLLDAPAQAPMEGARAPSPPAPTRVPAPQKPQRGTPAASTPDGSASLEQTGAADAAPEPAPGSAPDSLPSAAQAALEREPARAAPAQAPTAERLRRQLTLSAAALVATGVAPVARVGGAFALGLLSRRSRRLELAANVGLRVVQRYGSERDGGRLEMAWWSASAAACAGTALGARGALDGCLAGELGRLDATGSDTAMPASSRRLWAALGPALRGRWHALGPLSLEGGLLALFPFSHHRYTLGEETVFTVPWLTFRVELGLSLQFP